MSDPDLECSIEAICKIDPALLDHYDLRKQIDLDLQQSRAWCEITANVSLLNTVEHSGIILCTMICKKY